MKKILVVDDERKIRKVYNQLLTPEGFRVIEASNAVDATEMMIRENVDLILLDIKMPEIDGNKMYKIVEIVRKYSTKLKVIVASVYPLDEQKKIIAGADDYYDKSQGVDVLLTKINRALKDGSTNERDAHD